jgi:hypothetical protein
MIEHIMTPLGSRGTCDAGMLRYTLDVDDHVAQPPVNLLGDFCLGVAHCHNLTVVDCYDPVTIFLQQFGWRL